jgi:hypothetical protein
MARAKFVGLGEIAISNDLSILNVLLVESLNLNLLLVAQLCDLGFKYVFSIEDMEIVSVDGSNISSSKGLGRSRNSNCVFSSGLRLVS